MVCCSSAQDIRCLCHSSLERISSSDLGVKGGDRKKACHLGAVCPSPPSGDRRAQCDPVCGRPKAGHSVAFVPGPGSHLGLPSCNWCQGRRGMGVGAAGLAGLWGGTHGSRRAPLKNHEGRLFTSRPPTRLSLLHPPPGKPQVLGLPAVTSSWHTAAGPVLPAGAQEE